MILNVLVYILVLLGALQVGAAACCQRDLIGYSAMLHPEAPKFIALAIGAAALYVVFTHRSVAEMRI